VNWPYQGEREREQIHAEGAAPILVVGTTGDPATPYEWAVALADQLESGVLVSYDGEGHTAYNKSNRCVNDAVEAYLIEGTVPAADPMC
jgi:homoserine acetyltransferase